MARSKSPRRSMKLRSRSRSPSRSRSRSRSPSRSPKSVKSCKNRNNMLWVKAHKSHDSKGKVIKVKGACRKKHNSKSAKKMSRKSCSGPRMVLVKAHKSHDKKGRVIKVRRSCRKMKRASKSRK